MKTLRLRLPATSANLGPGFDTLALAFEIFLEIDAAQAPEFSIEAEGRNREICASLKNNLLIETYSRVLSGAGLETIPLSIRMQNGIPLGMGCGSSAAVRLAGVALAAYFGGLGWDSSKIVEEAARQEGHPDNVAACWYGGFTVAAGSGQLAVLSIAPPPDWRALVVLPEKPVATSKSRSALPDNYSKRDVVANVQNVALLTAAFALGRGELLPLATQDHLHQPFRSALCPLLPALLPLAGDSEIMSVTLSGAGPSVLLLGWGEFSQAKSKILQLAKDLGPLQFLEADLCSGGVKMTPGIEL